MNIEILSEINRLEEMHCSPCQKLVGINKSADVRGICDRCPTGQKLQVLGRRLNGEAEPVPKPPPKPKKIVEVIAPIEVRTAEALIHLSEGLDFEEIGKRTGLSKVAIMTIHSKAKGSI